MSRKVPDDFEPGEHASKETGRRGVSQKIIGQRIPKDKLPKEKEK